MRWNTLIRITVVFLCLMAAGVNAAEGKISVLLVDGMNNHDWERGTKLLKAILENCGMFTVEV
jgi:hypothetical protein